MRETKYCGLPIGNPCNSIEMQEYFNHLLEKIDCKIHNVELLVQEVPEDIRPKLVEDVNHLKCDVICLMTKIEEVFVRVRGLQQADGEQRADIININLSIDNIRNDIVEINNNIIRIDDTLDSHTKEIENLHEKDTMLSDEIDSLKNDVEDFRTDVETAFKEVRFDIETIGNRVDDNTQKIDEIEEQLGTAQETISEHEARLSTAESDIIKNANDIAKVDSDLDEIEAQVKENTQKIADAETRIGNAEDSLRDVRDRMIDAEHSISVHEQMLQNVEVTMNELKASDAEQDARLAEQGAKVSELQGQVIARNEIIDGLVASDSAQNIRIAALEKKAPTPEIVAEELNALKEDYDAFKTEVGDNVTIINQSISIIEKSIDDVSDAVAAVEALAKTNEAGVEENKDNINLLLSENSSAHSRLDTLGARVGEDEQHIETIKNDIDDLQKKVDALETSEGGTSSDLSSLAEKVSANEAMIENLEEMSATTNIRVDGNTEQITETMDRVTILENWQTSLIEQELPVLTNELANAKQDIQNLQTVSGDLGERVSTLESEQSTTKMVVDGNTDDIAQLTQRVVKAEGDIDTVQGHLEANSDAIIKNAEDIANVIPRVSTLENDMPTRYLNYIRFAYNTELITMTNSSGALHIEYSISAIPQGATLFMKLLSYSSITSTTVATVGNCELQNYNRSYGGFIIKRSGTLIQRIINTQIPCTYYLPNDTTPIYGFITIVLATETTYVLKLINYNGDTITTSGCSIYVDTLFAY